LGFRPAVFYSDTIFGDKLPNLTYMLVFEDREHRDRLWDTFMNSDGWEKLSGMGRYQDTVSKVHNWFLRPMDCSQL
ncbi:MAG: NIPSNAP family protein, partial [Planctomycetota bacterium]